MSAVREAIRNANRLARMRLGQAAYEFVEIPSIKGAGGETLRLAQVPLTEAETQAGIAAAAALEVEDNMAGVSLRNRAGQVSDAWHSLRLPDDLTAKAFESVEEMIETLEPTDVDAVVDSLAILMDYSSPSVDGLTEEALEHLKKAFAATEWSELSGRRWAAVKLCCQALVPELLQALLQARSSGSTSTGSSTKKSDGEEST